jgi:hypothetical protein
MSGENKQPMTSIDLFHGTCSLFLDEIFRDGLLPSRAHSDKWNHGWSARPDLVYLTQYWAAYYAFLAPARLPEEIAKQACAVILKISVDPEKSPLFPDEDFICRTLRKPPTPELQKIAEEFDLSSPKGINPTDARWPEVGLTWEESLRVSGTVASRAIPKESIIGIYEMRTEDDAKAFANENGPLRPGPVEEMFYAKQFCEALMSLPYRAYNAGASDVQGEQ